MITWFKNLFKKKPDPVSERPFGISDKYIAEQKRRQEIFKSGGVKGVKRWEAKEAEKKAAATLKPSYPPTRPTDGYQPSLKARTASPTRSFSETRSTTSDPFDAVTDALIMDSILSSHRSASPSPAPCPAPDVSVTTRDYTEPPSYSPPPAPAPSYEPSYSAPAPSYSSSPSFSSSDSYSSSSSYDSSSSSSSSWD